jgi:hypothetical protein
MISVSHLPNFEHSIHALEGPAERAVRSGKKHSQGRLSMTAPQPAIGEWYRATGGDTFEVVAIDDDDGTIEIQYFDGTVEEMDVEDWVSQWDDGVLEAAEPPEDWSGSVDVDPDQDNPRGESGGEERDLRASGLEGIDLFE